ncbi:MAG: chemotaxis protein CheB [Prevotellaceae bacterium]|jgi:two-component system chemotaxis response regulator CheB|nr:chemotaxis protein CheB [Prevotellaceae bacterium]
MQNRAYKAVVIGGSAGSFQVLVRILNSLPKNFNYPVFLCMHRLKHIRSGFVEALSLKSNIKIVEPYDKTHVKSGIGYLAPANYHMYVELANQIALSTEDPVNHSRPSIDLTYMSAANVYRNKLVGIILSGANKDGAWGMKKIADLGGTTIVQDPQESEVRTMPEATLNITSVTHTYKVDQIIRFLNDISK